MARGRSSYHVAHPTPEAPFSYAHAPGISADTLDITVVAELETPKAATDVQGRFRLLPRLAEGIADSEIQQAPTFPA